MSYPRDLDEYSEEELYRELTARRITRDAGMCDYCNRPFDSPSCKEYDRHKGEVIRGPLFFSDVTRVNVTRCKRWHPGFPKDDEWVISDWSNAMAGEAGEVCNVVKKIRRVECNLPGNRKPGPPLKAQLADEIADTFIYLDLLAFKAGVSLEQAVVHKFNIVSEELSMPERL